MLGAVSDELNRTGQPDDGSDRRTELADQRTDLADRRTSLANERTLLAWWRTGLAALAVGLGVGRLLPEVTTSSTRWPYIAVGVAFAVYGIALLIYGTRRSAERDPHLLSRGGPHSDPALAMLTVGGVLLGVASAVLILAQ
jgi:uncharacterized membrane protein YidH (DUF202 family)